MSTTYTITDGGISSSADQWEGCPEFAGDPEEVAEQAVKYARKNATETDRVTVRVFDGDTNVITRSVEIGQDEE